jgi:hypothetical protein
LTVKKGGKVGKWNKSNTYFHYSRSSQNSEGGDVMRKNTNRGPQESIPSLVDRHDKLI